MFLLEAGQAALTKIDTQYPYRKPDFYQSLRESQLSQQMWWYDYISNAYYLRPNSVNVYASGYAIYSIPLLVRLGVKEINLYDYDKEICDINWEISYYYQDRAKINIHLMDVVFDSPWIDKSVDLVLNTSCEVMYDFRKMRSEYPKETKFILQGTNMPHIGNINLSADLDSFVLKSGLIDIDWEQTVVKDGYERYMVIGS